MIGEQVGIEVNGEPCYALVTDIISPETQDINPAAIEYIVHLCTWDGRTLTDEESGGFQLRYKVLVSQTKRSRQILSKNNFKDYIKSSAIKESWIGAPWKVKVCLIL